MMQLDFSKKYQVLLGEADTLYVCLVGVGGTGSALALSLGRLAYHLVDAGISVDITLVDHDTVEEINLGRQAFCVAKQGWNKSETMAIRLNAAFGLNIRAAPIHFRAEYLTDWWFETKAHRRHCLLIGAVDNHLARYEMAKAVERHQGRIWWLDTGNAHHNGQILMGNLGQAQIQYLKVNELGLLNGLPAPHLQAPDLLEPEPGNNPALSCAELTAREEQSLTVNQMVAALATQYCYEFLVRGRVTAYETTFTLEPPTTVTKLITEKNLTSLMKRVDSADRSVS